MTLTLEAQVRNERGKGAARKARQEGMVPGVVYGQGHESVDILVEAQQLNRLLQSGGSSGLIDLVIDGNTRVALIKDVQSDPTGGRLLHVDFHVVALDRDVQVTVPVVTVGEEARANDGGIINLALRELSVSCLPTAIPERIEVNVAQLGVGDIVTVGQIDLPEGVATTNDPEEAVVTVVLPAAQTAADSETSGQAADDGDGEPAPADGDGGEDAE